MTEHQINETKIKIHNNFHTPVEKVKATFRGLKTLLLGGGLVCWGYFQHVNKDILFLCVFLLAVIITVKSFLNNEFKRICLELIKARKGGS